MSAPTIARTRTLIALAALLFGVAHIASEYVAGGIQSHHLLQRADLPAISNAWGLLILPLLGWIVAPRLRTQAGFAKGAVVRLAASMLYGATLAASFSLGYAAVTEWMFLAMFAAAAALPVHRSEYIAGFVIGMTFTFGAVLPTLAACVFALLSAVLRGLFGIVVAAARRVFRHGSGAA